MSLEKFYVKFMSDNSLKGPIDHRCYTLTHSDFTGELFLSIGFEFDKNGISGFYTRLMRDEVLAELLKARAEHQRIKLGIFEFS